MFLQRKLGIQLGTVQEVRFRLPWQGQKLREAEGRLEAFILEEIGKRKI